jgi:diguanylate cyclase (GGDEF)-like protein
LSGVAVARAIRDESGAVVDLACDLMNGAAGQIFGRSNEVLLGRSLVREVPNFDSEGLFRECISVIESGLPFNQERRYTFSGSAEWLHTVVVRLGDGCAITFTNITARKQAEEQLRHAALHDVLTGLPNRAMFIERLEQALHWAQGHHHYSFAVMFFDFDRFKAVNDNLGHEIGDALLMSIAQRLREQLGFDPHRGETGHLPARLGGDEFVVLLDGANDVHEVMRAAHQIQTVLNQPHLLNEHEVVSTASIGIVMCDSKYECADHILRDADLAMYEAKRAGRSRYVVFEPSMRAPQYDQRAA